MNISVPSQTSLSLLLTLMSTPHTLRLSHVMQYEQYCLSLENVPWCSICLSMFWVFFLVFISCFLISNAHQKIYIFVLFYPQCLCDFMDQKKNSQVAFLVRVQYGFFKIELN